MTEPNELVPAMYEHCCNVYEAMSKDAKPEVTNGKELAGEEPWDETESPTYVYEGYLTRLFQGLELSPPYYTQIRDLLTRMGCIEQLRRGGGNAKSRWRLVRAPTEADFTAANAQNMVKSGRVASLEQQNRMLNQRVSVLEKILGVGGEV